MESDTLDQESAAAALKKLSPSESPESSKKWEPTSGDGVAAGGGEEAPPTKRQKTADEKEENREEDEDSEESVDEEEDDGEGLVQIGGTISPRHFQRIPVFIVDYHNDVLEFIYRCFATRHLPLQNNTLVHFDSHPDLVIPRHIAASSTYQKDTMLNELSIENWIMPTLYAGHFNRVVWLKNSWCQQLPTGRHDFKVGQKDDRIGVDCPLDYFIADGNYCTTEDLQDAKSVELQVHDADNESLNPNEFLTEKDAKGFVLDIDLDFFSTSNPFLEIYKDADCYNQLKEIFHFESVEKVKKSGTATIADYLATAERRQTQLDALKTIFWHLEEERNFEGLEKPDETVVTPEVYAKIVKLADQLQEKYPDDEIDWHLIFDSGSTTDNNGLPHHISTAEELEAYFANFKRFLQRLPVPPVAITMAHSAQDDYCPQDQVAFIEECVLRLLKEVFGERLHDKAILHYMDDPWDVMKL
ncbi:UPF0489 protein C5orf22 homolog [Drosophila simulans]|uniref:GD14787 n=1 Tax=Drosophila simulans TaxID=7240 RepID=B4QQC6_DROSI|nr:UPF0489 protein C5orf22 homolog [Drosophila simulans]EDX11032.1 GD14787 [Drosophila simulans]KMZ00495.1 uncharacterized protein Dsimw501_GD14787 [Drosophila simulans]